MGKIFSAGTLSLMGCLLIYPYYIQYMKKKAFGQQIRPEGPENHYVKKDTPTMGGIILILMALLSAYIFMGKYLTPKFYALLIMVIAALMLGLSDDWSKIFKKQSLGLRAREKLLVQLLLGCFLVFFFYKFTRIPYKIIIPLIGSFHSKYFFAVFAVFVVVGTINAVNLTDGLDGLASGVCAICFLVYMVICYKNRQFDLAITSFAFTCACVGFLWYNAYPAKIFMGDAGSLALGAALATIAVFTRTEFLFVLIGGILVAEALSVIIQVTYFKLSGGKRIFKMSPLHHHFEKSGWHEVEVTIRFWIITLFLAVLGLILYFKEFLIA